MMKMIVVEARRSSRANRWMADLVPSVTFQRDGEARSSLIRTDPYQETTNPRTRFGPAIAVLDRTRRQGGRAFDWHNRVSATGSEGSHLGQLIRKRLAGREVIHPEHSGRLAPILRKTVKPDQSCWTGRTAGQSHLCVASPVTSWHHI